MIEDSYFYNTIISTFKNCGNLKSRASRSALCLWYLFILLGSPITLGIIQLFSEFTGISFTSCMDWLFFPLLLIICVFTISLKIRRVHDIGFSGYTLLWGLIPFVSLFLLLWLLCKKGEPLPNDWGSPPHTPKNYASILFDRSLLVFIAVFLLFRFVISN